MMAGIGKDVTLGALLIIGLGGIMLFATSAPSWMTGEMKALAILVFILIIFAGVKMAF
jgi:hypothetical protein